MHFGGILRKCLVELLTFKGNYKIGLLITKELSVYRFIFNISRAIFCADFSPFRPHLTQKNHHFDSKNHHFRHSLLPLQDESVLVLLSLTCCFGKTKRRFVRTKRRFAKINRRFDINKTPFYSEQSKEFENQLFVRCKFLWFRLLQTAQKRAELSSSAHY